jgi:hypothetical protein
MNELWLPLGILTSAIGAKRTSLYNCIGPKWTLGHRGLRHAQRSRHGRATLAYWASDIHAVSGAPPLRSLPYGRTATIDDIQAALCDLDEMVDFAAIIVATSSGVAA